MSRILKEKHEIFLDALKRKKVFMNPNSIGLINEPSEDVKLVAVRQKPESILSIENPSEAVQLASIGQNYNSADLIKFIENPSEAVQLAAVNKNGCVIKYIQNPSEAVQLAAIHQYFDSYECINKTLMTESVKEYIVSKNANLLFMFEDPSENLKMIAINKDHYVITRLKEPSVELVEQAMKIDKKKNQNDKN